MNPTNAILSKRLAKQRAAETAAETIRVCSHCKIPKPLSDFPPNNPWNGRKTCWCHECTRVETAERRRRSPEKSRASSLASYARHKEQYKAKREATKRVVFAHYGGKCACCGEDKVEFLSIDHKDGDGWKHRHKISRYIYDWIVATGFPDNLRVLCMNCNFSLGKFGYCPHRPEVKIPFHKAPGRPIRSAQPEPCAAAV